MTPAQEHALLSLIADLASENEHRARIIAGLQQQLQPADEGASE